MRNAIPTKARAAIALATIACVGLGHAAPARGGSYRAALCNPDLPAWHADAAFERSSRHYVSAASCGVGSGGLVVSHDGGGTRFGAWGAWTVRAPGGTTISGLALSAAGRAEGGHVPELLAGPAAGLARFATPAARLGRLRWSGGGAQALAARLRCRLRSGCGRGRGARVRVKRITVRLEDRVGPTLALGGSLLVPGSRRGFQSVASIAGDVGGGIRRFLLQVNGEPVTAHTVSCRLADKTAVRLRPCPPQAGASFTAATTSSPFRQGPNLVRLCVADYAATAAANRSCAERRVRIDNLCPVSKVSGGAALSARLRRDGRRAIVTGRLAGDDGNGLAGARVCVATRVPIRGSLERIAASPLTGAEGRFRARLPRGPSRAVRIAYWPSTAEALERYLPLRVPARPRLRLRPGHPIENGNRVRFEVRLPGPRSGGRRVRIQARAGHRWLDVRGGQSGPGGTYRARYRFHATTGRRSYAFRAVVPKQRGYPYEAGRSRVKRATVIG